MTKRILYNTVIQNPFLMRMVGLEPTRSHLRKILSLVRLPFRHIRSKFVSSPNRDLSYHIISTFAIAFFDFFQFFSKKYKISLIQYIFIKKSQIFELPDTSNQLLIFTLYSSLCYTLTCSSIQIMTLNLFYYKENFHEYHYYNRTDAFYVSDCLSVFISRWVD